MHSSITVNGGRLVVISCENALEVDSLSLSDVILELTSMDTYNVIEIDDSLGFFIPGTFENRP